MSSLVGAVSRSMSDPVAEALEGLRTAGMMAFLGPGGQSLLRLPSAARAESKGVEVLICLIDSGRFQVRDN